MHLWALMHQARKAGAKIVTIDPYRSKTAERSDWWLPIRPGTDAALALGMMHVLWRDGLQDDDYLDALLPRRRCSCASGPCRNIRPTRWPHITGMPAADIERLAHEYATTSSPR